MAESLSDGGRAPTFGGNLVIIRAASFVSMLIPLMVFFAFQRYFAKGLLAGSVK